MAKKLINRVFVLQVLICIIALVAWEAVGRQSKAAFFLVGSPSAVGAEFWKLLTMENLASHFVATGSEAVIGLLIGTFLGGAIGLSLWYSETAALIARPFIIGLGTLPIFAFAPLMIVWFGIGWGMKVALAAFSTVFVAFNQSYRGATLVSGEYVDVLKGMDASRHQIFLKVIVPGSLDWVLSSMRLNVGFGLLGAFIGEFIAADRGLGYLILRAGGLYNIPRAFAAAIGITVLALLLDACARYIEGHRHSLVQVLSVPSVIWNR
ncbi:ABC transporter permease [uncultured Paludibaculum sp.]|uniref:ABC transporter permease n=1 Tax=uncultured Paludibaculum sp. TaxID=1765020 RepID=UPI002AAABFF7|nr:ABC transporter permease [uncultured Paludibaculum sp.]